MDPGRRVRLLLTSQVKTLGLEGSTTASKRLRAQAFLLGMRLPRASGRLQGQIFSRHPFGQ